MRPRHREDPELTSELKANLLEDNMSVVSRIAKAREKVTTACIMHRVCAAFACFSVHVCIGMFALIFRSVRVCVCVYGQAGYLRSDESAADSNAITSQQGSSHKRSV
jgi:hypothetical protein